MNKLLTYSFVYARERERERERERYSTNELKSLSNKNGGEWHLNHSCGLNG